MKTAVTIGGYALGLLAVFGAAFGAGAVLATGSLAEKPGAVGEDHAAAMAAGGESTGSVPGGLMVSQDGYTLVLADRTLPTGARVPLRFTVSGPDGLPVTAYQTEHDEELHLIAVRRDLTDFQHVHPVRDFGGTWSVPLDLPSAGEYRIFADFTPVGHDGGLVLGADLSVPGVYAPESLPLSAATATPPDGYVVALQGALVPGESSELTLTVTKDGLPVTDLDPYLAAYGHLVALRAGDLAFLHVHPVGEPGDGTTAAGPAITFYADVPTAGDYRLYLDFQHQGVVRTAAFTVHADAHEVGSATAGPTPTTATAPEHGEGG
jgi:hypothetical protein